MPPSTINNSRKITSNQQAVHESLESVVRKHFQSEYKKPIALHTRLAFDEVSSRVEDALEQATPLLFDSFCGTGLSTRLLAKQHPEALVIGIDRSIQRLSKNYSQDYSQSYSKNDEDELPRNALLIQAECADFWLLANRAGWKLKKHSIYYPNPYPKAKHLKRRWHAHPAYPQLLSLGGEVELRTNWKIYADEFCESFAYAQKYAQPYLLNKKASCSGVELLSLNEGDKFMTLFEKKYHENGQALYCCKYSLY